MTSQVQIYNVSQAFCPLDQHAVRDVMDGGLAASLSTTIPHIVSSVGKIIYNSCTAQDGYCNQELAPLKKFANSIKEMMIVIIPAVDIRWSIAASLLLTYVRKPIYNSCTVQGGYCNDAFVAISNAIDESRQNGWIKIVEDYVKPKWNNTTLQQKYRFALGVGLLSTTIATAGNSVGKIIYNSCTAQGGYCNDAYVAISNAIDESRQNGWMNTVKDYVKPKWNNTTLQQKYRFALGGGLLSTTVINVVQNVVNYVGERIYNSSTVQD